MHCMCLWRRLVRIVYAGTIIASVLSPFVALVINNGDVSAVEMVSVSVTPYQYRIHALCACRVCLLQLYLTDVSVSVRLRSVRRIGTARVTPSAAYTRVNSM